jgi:succinylglutamate desuccinylase
MIIKPTSALEELLDPDRCQTISACLTSFQTAVEFARSNGNTSPTVTANIIVQYAYFLELSVSISNHARKAQNQIRTIRALIERIEPNASPEKRLDVFKYKNKILRKNGELKGEVEKSITK